MRIILLGGPGAGKGTQAQYLANHLKIPLISTGNMLRAAVEHRSELSLRVKLIMDQGSLVPDDTIMDLIKDRLLQPDCQHGYLLDGFPRTIAQAEALSSAGVKIDYVVEIVVPDNEIVARLSGRRIHLESGRTYHLQYNPPQTSGVDNLTGESLVQRDDDQEATIRQRLQVYHEKTELLVSYYQSLVDQSGFPPLCYVKVDGVGKIAAVRERIFSSIHPQA